jgi:diaminopimelate epimerase
VKNIDFIKMHGLGNDFILLDGIKKALRRLKWDKLAVAMCHRQTGVGADGLILMLPSREADFRMRIFNSDGSEAEMCGNGFRCMIRYLFDKRYSRKKSIEVETMAGIIAGQVVKSSKSSFMVKVAMGRPVFDTKKISIRTSQPEIIESRLKVGRETYIATVVSMGNPHIVLFVDNLKFDWKMLGPRLEMHHLFPQRANVEFVHILSRKKIEMRSWERGAGPTMASGTGAAAAAAAGIRTGKLNDTVEVKFESGSLFMEYDRESGQIYKTGPAEYCFKGTYQY